MIQRAILYSFRKKVRTTIMVGILCLTSFMGIFAVSLQSNINLTIKEIREKTGACFTVEGLHDVNKEENFIKVKATSDGALEDYYIAPDVDESLISDVMEQGGILRNALYGNAVLYLENGKVFSGLWSDEERFFYDGQTEEELSKADLEGWLGSI